TQSGVLGRSPVYRKLLSYLKECTTRGTAVHEMGIAVDVLGRTDFDPTPDTSLRVYVHKRRQKIEQYYRDQAAQQAQYICIPKGEYRLQIVTREKAAEERPARRSDRFRIAIGAAAVVIGLLLALPALLGSGGTEGVG